jgi:hypothetical protein
MKKLLIITNLFWVFVFILSWSKFQCSSLYTGNTEDCNNFCYNYSNVPFQGLTVNAARKMSENYQSMYQARIGNVPQFDSNNKIVMANNESKSVWFPIDTLKNFIYQIEKSVCNLNCNLINKNKLGVRIYFAKYPSTTDSDFPTLPQPYYNSKTLFMVPTYFDNTISGNVDFDPRWSMKNDSKQCAPKSIDVISPKRADVKLPPPISGASYFLILAPNSDSNGNQNHQQICPPDNCSGSSM